MSDGDYPWKTEREWYAVLRSPDHRWGVMELSPAGCWNVRAYCDSRDEAEWFCGVLGFWRHYQLIQANGGFDDCS